MGQITIDEADIANYEHQLETLEESYADLLRAVGAGTASLLRRDELGWASLTTTDDPIDREKLLDVISQARVMAVSDPLIKRGVLLRVAYVWSQGVSITAKQEDGAEQDVNAVVQAFLDDPSNQDSFSSDQAQQLREVTFATDGAVALCLVTDPLYGRVQVRSVPISEIKDTIYNPDDKHEPWFYLRQWRKRHVEPGSVPNTTRTSWEDVKVYYPALGYRPTTRPRSIDGVMVEWDKPLLLSRVNQIGNHGIPDCYAAISWARGYRDFLLDWAKLIKALSRYAFQYTVEKGSKLSEARDRMTAAPAADTGNPLIGQTILNSGARLETINKSGATIDASSGLPLASMVAAALGVPVTILTANPTTTGARATADTLDPPLRNEMKMRQALHADIIRRVLAYVIDQAVICPRGALKGTVTPDPATGRRVVTLRGDQDRTVDITFGDVSDVTLKDLVEAIAQADGTELLPELVTARLLLLAFRQYGIEDVDDVMASLIDDDGNYIAPRDASAARSQQDAVAAGAVAQPDVPVESWR